MAGVSDGGSSKKRKHFETRFAYPRKRAVTACSLCRMRKVKCDNQRPVCGSCLLADATCDYRDSSNGDLSSFDPASLAILDKLNTAIELLQGQTHIPKLIEDLAAGWHGDVLTRDGESHTTLPSLVSPSGFSNDTFLSSQFPQDNTVALEEALLGPESCHNVLQWPILEGKFDDEDLTTAFFTQGDVDNSRSATSPVLSSVREEDAPRLVEHFLVNVHSKNPILDPSELVSAAKQIAEEGFKWDADSCMVLCACALANLAEPFSMTKPNASESSNLTPKSYGSAEMYYTAARKRIGLLDVSASAVQSIFLLGVYEMYSMRPLKAWMSFSQACAVFQTYLQARSSRYVSSSTRRLEQRLYWSCFKSECEMREQVKLPPSGLMKANHLDVFPSPPGRTPDPETMEEGTPASNGRQLHYDVEKSWFYYLSEIASRRLKNRVSTVLYQASPQSWNLRSVARLHRLARELDSQRQRYTDQIPDSSKNLDVQNPEELNYMLLARCTEIEELICRPFLYIVVHADPTEIVDQFTQEFADRAVDLIVESIRRSCIKHRHHGSWYSARALFDKAVMLLATVRSGRLPVPSDWPRVIQDVMGILQYWEVEAPDLGVAKGLLRDIEHFVLDEGQTYTAVNHFN